METVILIIMALVAASFVLKLTCHGFAGRIVLSAVAALFTMLSYEAASGQSKALISAWLSDTSLMLDTSVLLTIDVAFQIFFCFIYAAGSQGNAVGRWPLKWKAAYYMALWVPGLLIFPVLFAALTEMIFAMTGVDFQTVALSLSAVLLVGFPLLAVGVKSLIPEAEIRLELVFMINLLVAALGIVATVNGRTAATGGNSVAWGALAGFVAILAAGLLSGLIYYRYSSTKTISKLK